MEISDLYNSPEKTRVSKSKSQRSRELREIDISREALKFESLSREQLLRRLATLSMYSREKYRLSEKLKAQLRELRPPQKKQESAPKRGKK